MKAKLTALEIKLLHALQLYTHTSSLEANLVRIDAANLARKKLKGKISVKVRPK
jgi:hypothetical protein